MKIWTKPEFQLIDMNAEIGSYQEDFGDERDPVVLADADSSAELEPEPVTRRRGGGALAGGALA
jgi:hypothetical protein